MTVEVKGAAELAKTLRTFAGDLQHLTEAHRAAGTEVLRTARPRMRRRTGRMASSLTVKVNPDGAEIGTPVATYPAVQEFGWANHGITPSRALTSSIDSAQPAVSDIYFRAIDDAMGKVRGA